jgi:hypothetical protein
MNLILIFLYNHPNFIFQNNLINYYHLPSGTSVPVSNFMYQYSFIHLNFHCLQYKLYFIPKFNFIYIYCLNELIVVHVF